MKDAEWERMKEDEEYIAPKILEFLKAIPV